MQTVTSEEPYMYHYQELGVSQIENTYQTLNQQWLSQFKTCVHQLAKLEYTEWSLNVLELQTYIIQLPFSLLSVTFMLTVT